MGLRIELNEMGIGAAVIVRHAEFADRILREHTAGLAADKVLDFDDDVIPQGRLQSGIVDGLDEVGKYSGLVHEVTCHARLR
jgi:hypothetical protein